jgi:hypothetical protein
MDQKKFEPSWKKNNFWAKKPIPQISEEERLKKLRDEYAQIIIDVFPKRRDENYYSEMMSELEDNMSYINDFIQRDNISKRDEYLNNEIKRTKLFLDNLFNYDEEIIKNKKLIRDKKSDIFDLIKSIDILSERLGDIKKDKPFSQRNKETPEEIYINKQISEIPSRKNELESHIENLERQVLDLEFKKDNQEIKRKQAENYIEYINDNWERYRFEGCTIKLPGV